MKYGISFLIFLCWACGQPALNKLDEPASANSKLNLEAAAAVNVDSIDLSESFKKVNLNGARNIGEFFDHRLRFYKIDQPKLKINQAKVGELVLYFIDSTLARMRYEVNQEVGSYLLDSLGMSKFKPLDSLSKLLVAERKVYDKFTSRLHPDLKNYELIWRDQTSVKRYRVKTYEDSLTRRYFYQEMYGYKQKIRELEQMYYYLENSIPVLD